MSSHVASVLVRASGALVDSHLRVGNLHQLVLVRRLQSSGAFGWIGPDRFVLVPVALMKVSGVAPLAFPAFEKGSDGFWRVGSTAKSFLSSGLVPASRSPTERAWYVAHTELLKDFTTLVHSLGDRSTTG